MERRFRCSMCGQVFTGQSEDEVLQKAMSHMQQSHGKREMSEQEKADMRSKITEEQPAQRR